MKGNHAEGPQQARRNTVQVVRPAFWGAVVLATLLTALVVSRADALTAVLAVGMFALATGAGILALSALPKATRSAPPAASPGDSLTEKLFKVAAPITESAHVDQIHRKTVEGAEQLLETAGTLLFTAHGDKAVFRDCEGIPWEKVPPAEADKLSVIAAETLRNDSVGLFEADSLRERFFPDVDHVQGLAIPLRACGETMGALLAVGRKTPDGAFSPPSQQLAKTLALLAAISLKNADARELQINFYTHAVELLVMSMEGAVTPMNHLRNVAQYADILSRRLDMSDEDRRNIHFAALLHDIGMIKIHPDLRAKPDHFRSHPILGSEMVGRVLIWQDLTPIIKYHHENFDGSGYPERLKEQEIPLPARILSIAESFDAMTNSLTYRSAVSMEHALHELQKGACTRYDARLVNLFCEAVEGTDFHS